MKNDLARTTRRFTPRNFARWLLIKRENQACDFDDEQSIQEYFWDSGIPFTQILDDGCSKYVIHIKAGVQDIVFNCWWYANLIDSEGHKYIGKDLSHILRLIQIIADYTENEIVK